MRLVRCHNCGVPEGQEHRAGCPVEVCPGCGAQAVGHRCRRAAGLLRVPFLHFPSVCARCGAIDPPWFGVPDVVWTYYVAPFEREEIVCEPCFKTIVRLIDRYRPRPDWLPTKAEIATYRAVWSRFHRSSLRGPQRRRAGRARGSVFPAALRRQDAQEHGAPPHIRTSLSYSLTRIFHQFEPDRA